MMQPNTFRLLEQCIENGIELGLNRAYKHSDGMPSKQAIVEQVYQATLQELCEWFHFPEQQ